MTDEVIIDTETVHVKIKEKNGIRHEFWDKEQYERQPNALGRHPRYVCYEYPREEKGKAASIIYKPHCSNCGSLIEGDIKCHELLRLTQDNFCSPRYYFVPSICPNCGGWFDSLKIVLPEKE